MKGIEGKVVVITGASNGIGEATALLLAEGGAKVVLGARGSDRLKALADRIAASGGEVAYIQTDVKRREDLSNLVGLAIERYGKLDVLINNAGVAPISLLDELRVEDWEEMIDINLKGVLYGIAPRYRFSVDRVSSSSPVNAATYLKASMVLAGPAIPPFVVHRYQGCEAKV
jgi:NADP-dependent 3-hydroxy acid dehydrogenase YdfG